MGVGLGVACSVIGFSGTGAGRFCTISVTEITAPAAIAAIVTALQLMGLTGGVTGGATCGLGLLK